MTKNRLPLLPNRYLPDIFLYPAQLDSIFENFRVTSHLEYQAYPDISVKPEVLGLPKHNLVIQVNTLSQIP